MFNQVHQLVGDYKLKLQDPPSNDVTEAQDDGGSREQEKGGKEANT